MRLAAKLDDWVEKGLLSKEQAQRITEYEEQSPRPSWVLYGLVGIGSVALMTGVVSIIAANWDDITPAAKLTLYFLIQFTLGALLLRRLPHQGIGREILITLFALFFLGGIGLVGQIYNLQSDGWQALLFWAGLALPVTLLAHSRLINHLWFGGVAIALGIWTGVGPEEHERLLAVIRTAFVFAGIGLLRVPWLSVRFAAAARLWSFALILGFLPLGANIILSEGIPTRSQLPSLQLWLSTAVLIVPLGALWLSRSSYERLVPHAIAAVLGSSWLVYALSQLAVDGEYPILGCAAFLLPWTCAALWAALAGRRRLFDLTTFVIAARFIGVYFQVFGSLMATGVGLIFSGVVIIGTALLWHRYRKQLMLQLGAKL